MEQNLEPYRMGTKCAMTSTMWKAKGPSHGITRIRATTFGGTRIEIGESGSRWA
jgi:hypothetical protein